MAAAIRDERGPADPGGGPRRRCGHGPSGNQHRSAPHSVNSGADGGMRGCATSPDSLWREATPRRCSSRDIGTQGRGPRPGSSRRPPYSRLPARLLHAAASPAAYGQHATSTGGRDDAIQARWQSPRCALRFGGHGQPSAVHATSAQRPRRRPTAGCGENQCTRPPGGVGRRGHIPHRSAWQRPTTPTAALASVFASALAASLRDGSRPPEAARTQRAWRPTAAPPGATNGDGRLLVATHCQAQSRGGRRTLASVPVWPQTPGRR